MATETKSVLLECYSCDRIKPIDEFALECMCRNRTGVCTECDTAKYPHQEWAVIPSPSHYMRRLHKWTPEYTAWVAAISAEDWSDIKTLETGELLVEYYVGPDGERGVKCSRWRNSIEPDERLKTARRVMTVPPMPRPVCLCCSPPTGQ